MSNLLVVLSPTTNGRGDLFGELTQSFFSTLGYEKFRLNVHKSGREIDIQGQHYLEAKQLVAECKATAAPVGGDVVNKFVGALDVERRRGNQEVIGYIVSLNGFTQTAIEQERDLATARVILIDGPGVVDRLIRGRIVVSREKAFAVAGACVKTAPLAAEDEPMLLAHQLGFIWAIFFGSNCFRTHFALVHADGEPLASQRADELKLIPDSPLHGLIYLPPEPRQPSDAEAIDAARKAYFSYIEAECGEIQLEGLPADQEVGSRRLRLESIFVPSFLIRKTLAQKTGDGNSEGAETETTERVSAGEVLASSKRIAILGLPGSGKSTLLKRLSTAYAVPGRMALVDDSLPQEHFLPIFIRCRQLGSNVKSPITEILQEIPARLEMDPNLASGFHTLVRSALRDGKALLLVDGLDEISVQQDRVAFVQQLRTFLHRYPAVAVVITSREAGFRIVGSSLSSVCEHLTLSPFDDADIIRLTTGWHKEVVGDRAEVEKEAKELALTIVGLPRVRQLAGNPLLLTTLLLVKRWVGSLPTKRSVLYGKAIEVLLATWNVEGHEPLEQEEVLPQLEYVAYAMMQSGIQQIGLDSLRKLLIKAREAMPELLSYSKIGPSDLIERVELRSSLLMQSGLDIFEGTLTPVYEFRHLTFQEYLTAQAIVGGHYSGADDSDTLLSTVKPYIDKENWKEVISLALVLSGKRAGPVLEHLMTALEENPIPDGRIARTSPAILLQTALQDEVQMSPDMLRKVMRCVITNAELPRESSSLILSGKYGDAFCEVAHELFVGSNAPLLRTGSVLVEVLAAQEGVYGERELEEADFEVLVGKLGASDWMNQAKTGLLVMHQFWLKARETIHRSSKLNAVDPDPLNGFRRYFIQLRHSLRSSVLQVKFSALWAIVWLVEFQPAVVLPDDGFLRELWEGWTMESVADLRYLYAWAITSLAPSERGARPLGDPSGKSTRLIKNAIETSSTERSGDVNRKTALIAAYYLQEPFSDEELLSRLSEIGTANDRHLHQIKILLELV